MAGYMHCTCRDCFEVIVGEPGDYCDDCIEGGCPDHRVDGTFQECQKEPDCSECCWNAPSCMECKYEEAENE